MFEQATIAAQCYISVRRRHKDAQRFSALLLKKKRAYGQATSNERQLQRSVIGRLTASSVDSGLFLGAWIRVSTTAVQYNLRIRTVYEYICRGEADPVIFAEYILIVSTAMYMGYR